MNELISCPGCQRKLQVPDTLVGQDVQCPTCGATFVARADEGAARQAAPGRTAYAPPERGPDRRDREDDYDRGRHDDRGRGRDWDRDRDQWGYRRRRDLMPHRASTVLTLGILSLVVCGPVMGPIAWVMGHQDLNEMRAGRMDPEGEGMTNAGKICGMVACILSAVGLALWLLWIVVIVGSIR